MEQSVRYHQYWDNLRKAEPVLLECMSFKYKSWSKVPLMKHVLYEFPVGEFPKIDAINMLAKNPDLFRLATPIQEEREPLEPIVKHRRRRGRQKRI